MIITKQNLEKSYKPVVFYWELGKKKEELITSEYEGVEFSYKERKAEVTKYKVTYGNEEDIKDQPKNRLGANLKTMLFVTNEEHDRIFVYFAKIMNNTRRGDEYVPYWDIDEDVYFEVDKDKNTFFHQDFYDTRKKASNIDFDQRINFIAQNAEDLKETFESVFGKVLSCDNELLNYNIIWRLTYYLCKRPLKMSAKNQEIFDNFNNTFGENRMILKQEDISTSINVGNLFMQMDQNPYGKYLFRYFAKYDDEELIEISRYFDLNGKDTFSVYDCGKWIKVNHNTIEYCDVKFCLSEKAKEVYKYKLDMLELYSLNHSIYVEPQTGIIKEILYNQIYEKLYKICSKEMFISMIKRFGSIGIAFGSMREDAKGFYPQLGVSRDLLNAYDELCLYKGNLFDVFKRIKECFGKNNISDLPIETFKNIINVLILKDVNQTWNWKLFECASEYVKVFNENDYSILIKIYNATHEYVDSSWRYPHRLGLLKDYYSMLSGLKDSEEDISVFPKLPIGSSIIRYHDLASDLFNRKQSEIKRISFEKQIKKRKGLEYSNEEFSLILPKESYEILQEGATLHHCVGGYVSRVENGRTTIIFLRRNTEIDKPFYTIEVNNENRIVQIHGFGNKYLGNDKEAIGFIADWIQKNKLTYDKRDILSDGIGYGQTGHLIENIWGL